MSFVKPHLLHYKRLYHKIHLKFNCVKRLDKENRPPETHHCNVIVALNNLPNLPHFVLNIARPDLTDYLTGICKCGWHVGRSGEKKPNKSTRYRGGGRQYTEKGKRKEKRKKKTQLWGKMKRKLVSEEKAN